MTSSVKPFAGPGATPSCAGQAVRADRLQRVPDGLARVARSVRVVQEQHVEGVDAAAFEAALCRHSDIVGVALRTAQARIREAREALGALAFALVEVVADGPDQGVLVARNPCKRAP